LLDPEVYYPSETIALGSEPGGLQVAISAGCALRQIHVTHAAGPAGTCGSQTLMDIARKLKRGA